MLGRTASSLYWMSRYMERAENMARLLEVGYRISLMPGAVEGHRDEWRSTLQSAACDLTYESLHDDITPKDVIHFLIFDERGVVERAEKLSPTHELHPQKLVVDVETKRLVSSFLSTRTTTPESAVFGDKPDISVRLVESNDDGVDLPWRYVDLTGYSIRVGIGNPGGDATSGTFTLTFDGDTTTALDYNATAGDIDTALNALASMVTAGGCTVTQATAGYQVTFDTVGARNIITATTDGLFPASSAYIYEATTGDGSTAEVQVVTLEVDNAAYIELTTDISAPSATVTVVREGVTDTTSELQRVEIDGDPYLGTWAVTINSNTSSAISVDATLAEITTAIEGITGIGAGNVTVTGSTLDFTIQFASSLGNVATAVIDVANLTGAVGKTGSIDLNTNQFLELLGGASSASATTTCVKSLWMPLCRKPRSWA